ncbi:MAG: hypothetical protein Q8R02_18155 [Hyphomonadaceae bacterium]|nr:hypothetical protein [Hyphomonadaceae bacterium]
MTANISTWLRAFRPPLQRAYSRLDETGDDFADLLELADERKVKDERRAKIAPRTSAGEKNRTKQ